jgi:hypothetical protein
MQWLVNIRFWALTEHTVATMAPKYASKGGRTLGGPSGEPNYARSVYQTVMNKENRSVVTAIGMFAVRLSSGRLLLVLAYNLELYGMSHIYPKSSG